MCNTKLLLLVAIIIFIYPPKGSWIILGKRSQKGKTLQTKNVQHLIATTIESVVPRTNIDPQNKQNTLVPTKCKMRLQLISTLGKDRLNQWRFKTSSEFDIVGWNS